MPRSSIFILAGSRAANSRCPWLVPSLLSTLFNKNVLSIECLSMICSEPVRVYGLLFVVYGYFNSVITFLFAFTFILLFQWLFYISALKNKKPETKNYTLFIFSSLLIGTFCFIKRKYEIISCIRSADSILYCQYYSLFRISRHDINRMKFNSWFII